MTAHGLALLGALCPVAERPGAPHVGSAAVELCVRALAQHEHDTAVHEAALSTLLRLACSSRAKRQAAARPAVVGAVGESMARHAQHAQLQTWGSAFAHAVAIAGNGARLALVERRTLHALVAAMSAHRSHVDLQQFGLQALREVAHGPHETALVEAGAARAAVRALGAHVGSARCAQHALALLRALAADAEAGRAAVAAEGSLPQLLKEVRKRHVESAALCELVDELVSVLAREHASASGRVSG